MTRTRGHRRRAAALLLALLSIACEGPVGPRGDPGETGPEGPPGPPGALPDAGPPPDAHVDDVEIPLEPEGLVGRVLDTTGAALAGGRVVLVPASAVAAMAETPIDPTLAPAAAAASLVDEPIEDLVDSMGAALPSASIDDEGVYRFVTLTDTPVFVVAIPPEGDTTRLPGGERAREAQARASLVGQRLDLRVSTRPSERARHVGSPTCTNCHGRHAAYGTAHFAGLSVPGRRGYLQDTSRWEDFDADLAPFAAGATLYFHSCDPAREPVCAVSDRPPPGPAVVSFEARLSIELAVPPDEPGRYRVLLVNRRAVESAEYVVELTYGGALERTQLIVSVARPGGPERHVLPFQHQSGGDSSDDRRTGRYRDIGSADWYDHATGTLRAPGSARSFDLSCAGCHVNGFSLAGDMTSGWRASALPLFEGSYDYDRDGRREELDVGCEGCHGAGSEHVDAGGRGVAIVSPQLLTAEREVAICASCHSRPRGVLGGSGAPLDASGHMPRPGLRRSELLSRHFSAPEVASGDLHASGDPHRPQLQAIAHVTSAMYRNDRILTTCSDCHDAHGGSGFSHDLRSAPETDGTCVGCHGEPEYRSSRMHVETATRDPHLGIDDADLRCVACHMPGTAVGGAMRLGLLDERPMTSLPVQYYEADLASHRYEISGFEVASAQPASVTQRCAACHALTIPNP